jgi:hypothetical protein
MKEKKTDVYLSGEEDVGNHLPEKYEDFFSKKNLFLVLLVLALFLAASELVKLV